MFCTEMALLVRLEAKMLNNTYISLRAQTALRGVVAPCYQHQFITRCHNSTQCSLSF